jgi:hypothetical protein
MTGAGGLKTLALLRTAAAAMSRRADFGGRVVIRLAALAALLAGLLLLPSQAQSDALASRLRSMRTRSG